MRVNAKYENLCLPCQSVVVKDTVKVECKTGVTADASGVLETAPHALVSECETKKGEIRYAGKAFVGVCYLSEDGSPKGTECGAEFSDKLKDSSIPENACPALSVCVKRVELKNGSTLSVLLTLEITATFTAETALSVLDGGEGLICKKDAVSYPVRYPLTRTTFTLREEFTLPYAVESVLLHQEDVYALSVGCGVGCIVCDGEAVFTAFLLPKGENRDIVKEVKRIAFRQEIDCENALPEGQATALLSCIGARVDVVVDEDAGSSTVKTDLTFAAIGAYSVNTEKEFVEDAYAKDCDVAVGFTPVTVENQTEGFLIRDKFTVRVPLGRETALGDRPLGLCVDDVSVADYSINGDRLSLTLAVDGKLLLKTAEGAPVSLALSFPVEAEGSVAEGLTASDAFTFSPHVFGLETRLVSGTEAEVYGAVAVYSQATKKVDLLLPSSLTVGDDKPTLNHAFSVYLAEEGEDLWTVSKRLNVSPEELKNTNPDLSFPLKEDERIVVYRERSKEFS